MHHISTERLTSNNMRNNGQRTIHVDIASEDEGECSGRKLRGLRYRVTFCLHLFTPFVQVCLSCQDKDTIFS